MTHLAITKATHQFFSDKKKKKKEGGKRGLFLT